MAAPIPRTTRYGRAGARPSKKRDFLLYADEGGEAARASAFPRQVSRGTVAVALRATGAWVFATLTEVAFTSSPRARSARATARFARNKWDAKGLASLP